MWFRGDLRVRDNAALARAAEGRGALVAVFCFDPREFGRHPGGLDRVGPHRARFLLECVGSLRQGLRARGGDLLVRVGRPADVLRDVVRRTGAAVVVCHQEVSPGEARAEAEVRAALEAEGARLETVWGSTLHHPEDLPFRLEDLPANYTAFRELVRGVRVRGATAAPEELRGPPAAAGLEMGALPRLEDLGVEAAPGALRAAGPELPGGEREALRRLRSFASDAARGAGGAEGAPRANFPAQISPWLAVGCVSPRSVLEAFGAAAGAAGAAGARGPLLFELLWRDFFRFVTLRLAARAPRPRPAPAPAR